MNLLLEVPREFGVGGSALHFPHSDSIFEAIPALSCRSLEHGLREIAMLWKARQAEAIQP